MLPKHYHILVGREHRHQTIYLEIPVVLVADFVAVVGSVAADSAVVAGSVVVGPVAAAGLIVVAVVDFVVDGFVVVVVAAAGFVAAVDFEVETAGP